MMMRLGAGGLVVLGDVLARAGEGTIFAVVDRPGLVAKVFHADHPDLVSKRLKLPVMVAACPEGATQADGFTVLTWPQDVLLDDAGVVAGYVMARIDTASAVEIHTLSNPVDRANPLPSAPQWTKHASWAHLVNVAANLCLAVETVHHTDAVIGDFQERNILVHDTTRVTLVDCDSMQVHAPDGRFFLCGVGRPEFTAPELAGVDLKTTPRQRPSDLFALAVHIHLLLMAGNHPFLRGDWAGGGDQPDAMSLARSGEWAGGPGSRLRTHPLAPPVSFLPPGIARLFVRAFTDGARDPNLRPSAAEWRAALQSVPVRDCPAGHQIPVEADPCPWCAIDAERAQRKTRAAAARATPVTAAPRGQSVMDIRPKYATATGAPTPAVAATPASSGRSKMPLIIAGVVGAFAVVGIGAYLLGQSGSKPGIEHPVATAPYTPAPVQTFVPEVPPPPPPPVQPEAVIFGTCDEGGTCGVKQRTGPYSAAPRLVSTDLYDGNRVRLACQTRGDIRSNDGRPSSDVWYRLDNGAYVSEVYMDTEYRGVPHC